MGFNNPSWTWQQFEAALSGRPARDGDPVRAIRRPRLDPRAVERRVGVVPYAELHCHTNFSWLDGASSPEVLVAEAAHLGLEALAITDHDGLYGAVRFAEAAREVGMPTVYGAEITLTPGLGHGARVMRAERETLAQVATGRGPHRHAPDPAGTQLVVLADGLAGYPHLARALSLGHLAGEKGAPQFTFADVADALAGRAWVLTGGRKGTVPAALEASGPAAARRELDRLVSAFGRDRVLVELWHHGQPLDDARNDALAELAVGRGVEAVAANDVRYATPAHRPLATALTAVRARRGLADVASWLPAAGMAHLRSGDEQARRFRRYPGVVEHTAAVARAAAFDLRLVAPRLPPFPCPEGLSEMAQLRRLVEEGAERRYGPRPGSGAHHGPLGVRAWATIDRELEVIEQLGFPGYFLVVWEIVDFCRRHDILCQGRGSAANSAVCYALGITNADAVALGLLFERFLSPERDGPPDIDVDIEAGRREEVIQHVYERYGRWHTAQVANVVTYRARSAVRDMARALGHAPGQQDAWAKRVDAWGRVESIGDEPGHGIPAPVLELAAQVEGAPRHLGIHSGGMVICDRPVVEVCPVEWARMERRSVLQWDKDDCAAVGLVKFDLLGLGMLSALHRIIDLVREHRGREVGLADLPQEDAVYEMLSRADSVGVFQVESRAQMGTLPRLKPTCLYDLVIQVALIRPGPIQGGSVHPYLRRRAGREPVTYLHPLMEPALRRTLGVPLFQEQLMQLAIDCAGFTGTEADQLRQAMSARRSTERMERLRERLYRGMAERGIDRDVADELYRKMVAFADYGFPESHSVSFAHLVYCSAWFKLREPAAFCAGLLNAQPMGFWSPHSLVQDARRHGVVVRTPDLNASRAGADLEDGGDSVRLGLASVRDVSSATAERVERERTDHGPYRSPEDLVRRVPSLTQAQLESLATAGAFGCFGLDRRRALWAAGAVAQSRPDRLAGVVTGARAPRLPGMGPVEESVADLWATGVSPEGHPTRFVRDELTRLGVTPAAELPTVSLDGRVVVAGVVTHRQRPATAQGTTFLGLEDETGLMNVVVSKGCWRRHRSVASGASALVVRGRLERSEGVVNVVAETLTALPLAATMTSRDFH